MKIRNILCLSIIMLLLSLTGCGKEESTADSPNTSTEVREDQAADNISDAAYNNSADNKQNYDSLTDSAEIEEAEELGDNKEQSPGIQQQYQCMIENKEVWLQQDASYYYSVTDMDENGYLELIRTTCQGSGHYSVSDLWTVNEDVSGLTPIEVPWAEGESQPDLLYGIQGYYYKDNEHYYILDDILSVESDDYYTKYALQIKDNKLLSEEISYYTLTSFNTGNESEEESYEFHYYYPDGTEVEEDAYYEIEQEHFADYESDYCYLSFSEISSDMEDSEIERTLSNTYNVYRESKDVIIEGDFYDYEFNLYTEEAEDYGSLSDSENLGGVKGGDTNIRFVCNVPNITVTLQEVEWLNDVYYFMPVSDVFTKELEKGQVYEFSGTLAEGVPQYRLKLDYYGNTTFWYLQYDGSGEAYGHYIVSPDYEMEPWPAEDDPIMDLLKAYAAMFYKAGNSTNFQNEYFWETIAAAVWMHGRNYGILEEDGSMEVNEFMMESYRKVLFPYAYDYEMPGQEQPVVYNEASKSYQVFGDQLFDPDSVEILSMNETVDGMLGIDFVIHGQTDEGVYILLLQDYDIDNAFGFIVNMAYMSEG